MSAKTKLPQKETEFLPKETKFLTKETEFLPNDEIFSYNDEIKPLAVNEMIYHTFLGFVYTDIIGSNELKLKTLCEEFDIDIKLSSSRTEILQNSKIIDKSFEICSTRSKNKKLEFDANGFIKASYPLNTDILLHSNPPELIPIGCYCTYCSERGPYAHKSDCSCPKKSKLRFTLDGIILSIVSGQYTVTDESTLYDDINLFLDLVKRSRRSDVPLKETIISLSIAAENEEIFSKLFSSDIESSNITLKGIIPLTKKDISKFFSGPMMLKYKNADKNITIRVRSNGNIEFISIPWSMRNLYIETIKRINKTSQKVAYKNSEIRTFFASVNLFGSNHKQFNLKKILKYLWPSTESGVAITKHPKQLLYDMNFGLRSKSGKLYKYKAYIDSKSSNRLYVELVTCQERKGSLAIFGPYKISIQLFSQGQLQMTFGYCKDIENEYIENYHISLDHQFEIIKDILTDVHQGLFLGHISDLCKLDPTVIEDIEPKLPSKKIYETVDGCIPYAKRKKYKNGDEVQVYSFERREWTDKIGIVESSEDNENDVYDKVYYVRFQNLDTSEIQKLFHSELRKTETNNDQVCRLKEHGILRQPTPYCFLKCECPGGYNQIVKPTGVMSRTDNRFYPSCVDAKKDDFEWTVNFLLNGHTELEKKKYLIDKKRVDDIDYFCATFKPGTCNIGSIVKVYHDDRWQEVQILEKNKTHGNGNDNIMVQYSVLSLDSSREEFKVTGRDFHESYIEDREFAGLSSVDLEEQKKILKECLIRLNMIRLHRSGPLYKNKVEFHNFENLNLINLNNLAKYRYMCVVIHESIENLTKCQIIISKNDEKTCLYEMISSTFEEEPVVLKSGSFLRNSSNLLENETITIHGYLTKDDQFYAYDISRNNFSENYEIRVKELYDYILKNLIKTDISFAISKSRRFNYIGPSSSSGIGLIKYLSITLSPDLSKNETILFMSADTNSKNYSYTNIKRKRVTVRIIQQNKFSRNFWKIGLQDQDQDPKNKGKDLKNFVDIDGLSQYHITDIKDSYGNIVTPKLYDYVSIKPNIMLDSMINPNDPIIEPFLVSGSDQATNDPKMTKKLVHDILYPINKAFLLSNKWYNFAKGLLYKDGENGILTSSKDI
jgi:hypothetical protein